MGEFDPVEWETIEAVRGPPAAPVTEHVERLRADVRDAEPYVAVKTIYDAWKADRDDGRSVPPQGAAAIVAYLLEREGVVTTGGDGDLPSLAARRPDGQRLRELFWERERTMWWIALRAGVHWALVQYWLYEERIPLRERNFPAEAMAEIRAHRERADE